MKNTRAARFYKVYLMPGPFFSEANIQSMYHMKVSWKEKDIWTPSLNPAFDAFKKYKSTLNPVYLNQSRLERALYESVVRKKLNADPLETQAGLALTHYLAKHRVPANNDSVRITVLFEKFGRADSVVFTQQKKIIHEVPN